MLFLFWLTLAVQPEVTILKGIKLDPVPEHTGFYTQYPADITIDKSGNIYVVDSLAKTVFQWDKDGHFIRNFGKPGQGPGEFDFVSSSKGEVYIWIYKDMLSIFDAQNRRIHFFDYKGKFLESIYFSGNGGRVRSCLAGKDNRLLIYQQNYWIEAPTSELVLYTADLKPQKRLYEYREKDFVPKVVNGARIGWKVNAYLPHLAIHSDPLSGKILLGTNERAEFWVLNSDGVKEKTISFNLARREVTQVEIQAFHELSWMRANPPQEIVFPDRLPYYDSILPVSGLGYLVFTVTVGQHKAEGILIDHEGKTLGRFKYNFGEGGLLSLSGRLWVAETDAAGDYSIFEMKLSVPENQQN